MHTTPEFMREKDAKSHAGSRGCTCALAGPKSNTTHSLHHLPGCTRHQQDNCHPTGARPDCAPTPCPMLLHHHDASNITQTFHHHSTPSSLQLSRAGVLPQGQPRFPTSYTTGARPGARRTCGENEIDKCITSSSLSVTRATCKTETAFAVLPQPTCHGCTGCAGLGDISTARAQPSSRPTAKTSCTGPLARTYRHQSKAWPET